MFHGWYFMVPQIALFLLCSWCTHNVRLNSRSLKWAMTSPLNVYKKVLWENTKRSCSNISSYLFLKVIFSMLGLFLWRFVNMCMVMKLWQQWLLLYGFCILLDSVGKGMLCSSHVNIESVVFTLFSSKGNFSEPKTFISGWIRISMVPCRNYSSCVAIVCNVFFVSPYG